MLRPINATASALLLILVIYAGLGTLFAVKTPPWQNPDEPAHYNYIAHIAGERQLPVLQMGDYDEAYLQRLKAEKFPPDLSIAPIRYESHQPPLYYLLAAPVYWLSGGQLLALRLFSVVLGGGVVLLIFLSGRLAVPGSPLIALGAAAFAALLPMHAALMASVNNDALAELLIAATVLALLRWQRSMAAAAGGETLGLLLVAGVLIGLGFLTKATAYILLPIGLLVVFFGLAGPQAGRLLMSKKQLARFALLLGPALILGLPWWIRNSLVYGNLDILGLTWHDAVVTGQPTAGAWIAENGWAAYWERAWTFTGKSFWGVFGWLGVFMDARVYTLFFVLSIMAAVGVVGRWRMQERKKDRHWTFILSSPWMTLLLLWAAAFAAYVWYNIGFIQHQGRYLFPALPAWSLLFAVGWWTVLERRVSITAGGILLAAAAVHLMLSLLSGSVADKWTLLLFGLAGTGLLLYGLLSDRIERVVTGMVAAERDGGGQGASSRLREVGVLRTILFACPYLVMVTIDIAIPFLYIVPQLGS